MGWDGDELGWRLRESLQYCVGKRIRMIMKVYLGYVPKHFTDLDVVDYTTPDGVAHKAYRKGDITKLADVTFDDDNNLIPLSRRFDVTNPDPRWSVISYKGEDIAFINNENGDKRLSENKEAHLLKSQIGKLFKLNGRLVYMDKKFLGEYLHSEYSKWHSSDALKLKRTFINVLDDIISVSKNERHEDKKHEREKDQKKLQMVSIDMTLR